MFRAPFNPKAQHIALLEKATTQLIDQSSIVLFKNVCYHLLIYP